MRKRILSISMIGEMDKGLLRSLAFILKIKARFFAVLHVFPRRLVIKCSPIIKYLFPQIFPHNKGTFIV
ncbi:MAG: hypothetical protein IJ796_09205 [Lachnospiraceae bacterium]|nr:hypothetical protein [Lachnospiraceae bacterium]